MRSKIHLPSHQHCWTNGCDIGTGEACIDAYSEDIRLLLIHSCRGNALDHRADVCSATIDFFEHGTAHADCAWFDFACHHSLENFSSVATGLAHIYMRIGFERNNDVSQRTHLLTDICMWIEGNGYRHFVAHQTADTPKQFTFAIFTEINPHSTMQAEEQSVELMFVDAGKNRLTKPFKRLAPDFAAWPGSRTEDMVDLPAMRTASIKETSKFRILFAPLYYGCCTHQRIAGHEGSLAGFVKAE